MAWGERLTALAGQPCETWAQQVGRWIQRDLAHLDALIDRSLWSELWPDAVATLAAIRCPMALIYQPEAREDAERMAASLARGSVTIAPVEAHRIHELAPAWFARHVAAFLAAR